MKLSRPATLLLLAVPLLVLSGFAAATADQAPPSATDPAAQIDRLVEEGWKAKGVSPAPPCSDRAFVRRVYLDLAGRIPTTAEADAFVADSSKEKRTALVDRLLASPEYSQHMRDVFDVVFMGRKAPERGRRRGQQDGGAYRRDWLSYLEQSFAQNRPWNQMVRDMLLARPDGPQNKGAVWFLYARQEKYQEIAETVSPAMFGVQVQCAQCHNHPLAKEILQAHYWGLVAFFNRGKNKITKDGPCVAESAVGGFSNFANLSGQSSPNELTFLGAEKVAEERPAEGVKQEDKPELYQAVATGSDAPAVPKFSRREQFVEKVVQGNPLVAKAAVNRFWALIMGRGIVHPVDKMDSKHPPSNPALLDWLAQDFEKSGFDTRRLVRSLVLSRAYGLDSHPVPGAGPELFAYGLEKQLSAEVLYRSLMVATGKPGQETPELREALITNFPDVFPEEAIATLPQGLFLTNNPMIQGLAKNRPDSTMERLLALPDAAARIKEAYHVAYNRDPDAEEVKELSAYLSARADRPEKALSQVWWALLAGPEFRFNH
jgi:hypothetical protein